MLRYFVQWDHHIASVAQTISFDFCPCVGTVPSVPPVGTWRPRRLPTLSLKKYPREVAPGVHTELLEYLAEVIVHRVGADEELARDLPAGGTLSGQAGDLQLPGGQVVGCLDAPGAGPRTRGKEFDPGPLGECPSPHGVEHLIGPPELLSSLGPSPLAAEPFPKEKMGPRHLGAPRGLPEMI